MKRLSFALLLTLSSCSSYMSALKDGTYENNIALREMNYEIEELKVALQQAKIEISALEDRLQTQEKEMIDSVGSKHHEQQLALFERRLDEIKAAQTSTLSELHALQNHASKTTTSLTAYHDKIHSLDRKVNAQDQRLIEVVKLKNTLSSISQAMHSTPNSSSTAYHIVAGDTLGKIAQRHSTTVDRIKEVNHLTSNRILVGQRLTIPH